MSWSSKSIAEQTGRVAIVTGGNSGLGFAAARVLAAKGAQVVLACRDAHKADDALARIRAESPRAQVSVLPLDLASLASVRAFAARFSEAHGALHLLINNAGVMAIPRRTTADGFEMQLGVNHLGHFALTGLLLGRLLSTPGARVVNVSSLASTMGKMRWDDLDGERFYEPWLAYGQSKLANLLFTFELARRLEAKRADVASLACHPGYAATNLQFVAPSMESSPLKRLLSKQAMVIGNAVLAQSAEAGAWPTLFAATSNEAHNGDFIGPHGMFGPWRGKPTHAKARKLAHAPEQMQKLWQVSVERSGVDFAALG